MKVKLPRVSKNVQYEIITPVPYSRHEMEVRLSCAVGGGETFHVSAVIYDTCEEHFEHCMESALREMEHAVGRFIVRGERR